MNCARLANTHGVRGALIPMGMEIQVVIVMAAICRNRIELAQGLRQVVEKVIT
jgi:hypothetical protein